MVNETVGTDQRRDDLIAEYKLIREELRRWGISIPALNLSLNDEKLIEAVEARREQLRLRKKFLGVK